MGLTIFTIPKAFSGDSDRIQRNAIDSWMSLKDVRLILMGDDRGVQEVAHSVGALHVPDIARTEGGTPRLDSAFEAARQLSSDFLLCYTNADIILPKDFAEVVADPRLPRGLLVGQRWECDVTERMDPSSEVGESSLRASASELGSPMAIDYFVFPRETEWRMPAFAVGRTVWDNWLIFRARELGMPVVDLTPSTFVAHQSHDYSHIADSRSSVWKGEEAAVNRRLSRLDRLFTIEDATHVLTPHGLKPAREFRYLRQRLLNAPLLRPRLRPTYRMILHATRRLRGLDSAL